jgi:acyl transferase domain-containing protein
VANINGEFYPTGPDVVPQMVDILARQVASPVQFVKGLQTLYRAGARVFVEVGPKKALQGFAEDVLSEYGDAVSIFTNHPKIGDVAAFNQPLCALYAAGLGRSVEGASKPARSSTLASAPVQEPAALLKSTPDRQHQGVHRTCDGRGHRRRGGSEGARNRMGAARRQLQGS